MIGRVSTVKPATMKAMMYSLRLSTRAATKPVRMLGTSRGRVTLRNLARGVAPSVVAASPTAGSMASRPRLMVTSGTVLKNTPWAMITFSIWPTWPTRFQNTSAPTALITGGSMNGSTPSPMSSPLPRGRWVRTP